MYLHEVQDLNSDRNDNCRAASYAMRLQETEDACYPKKKNRTPNLYEIRSPTENKVFFHFRPTALPERNFPAFRPAHLHRKKAAIL